MDGDEKSRRRLPVSSRHRWQQCPRVRYAVVSGREIAAVDSNNGFMHAMPVLGSSAKGDVARGGDFLII